MSESASMRVRPAPSPREGADEGSTFSSRSGSMEMTQQKTGQEESATILGGAGEKANGSADAAGAASQDKKKLGGGLMLNDPTALTAAGAWSLNVFSSVALIMANKAVMKTFEFRFVTSLTALHFCLTAGAGLVARGMGQLSETRLPFWTLFWFSIAADASVVTMNLSLMLNSVGFYQIAKLSIIPTCCVLEWLLHGKTFSREVQVAVAVVVLGVGVCTVTDVGVALFGFLAALAAVLSTTLQQIYIGQLQKVYNIGSFDLLSQTAPIQAVVLIATGPFIDFLLTQRSVFNYQLSASGFLAILASCMLALFVNISTYLCIGKFSAVSFQVLGHMKTVLVLVLGWTLFDSTVTLKNLGGMIMAVAGMIMYSWAIELDRARAAAAAASAASPGPEKEEEMAETAGLLAKEEGGAGAGHK